MEPFAPFLQNPLGGLSFLLLIVSLLSVWINRRFWLWAFFFLGSYACAYYGNIVELRTGVPIVLLFLCHLFLTKEISSFWRLFVVMIAAILSFGLATHFIQGFHNVLLTKQWQSTPDALPMNLYMNYDKPLIALFILGLYLPLINTRKALLQCLFYTLPWALFTIALVLALTYSLHLVRFELKCPLITPLWLILQLFFVVIPEEVFFRGFIQREIAHNLNNRFGGILAILVTSLLFAAAHLLFLPHFSYIIAVFIASILYGTIYQLTKLIEASILTHFLVNVVHFFFFTYPMLAS